MDRIRRTPEHQVIDSEDGFISTIFRIFKNTIVLASSFICLNVLIEISFRSNGTDKIIAIGLATSLCAFLITYARKELKSRKRRWDFRSR